MAEIKIYRLYYSVDLYPKDFSIIIGVSSGNILNPQVVWNDVGITYLKF